MAALANELQTSRARDLENALATSRLEGLAPSASAMVIFQKYADGELTLVEMGAAIDELSDLEYGPLRLPGNERT